MIKKSQRLRYKHKSNYSLIINDSYYKIYFQGLTQIYHLTVFHYLTNYDINSRLSMFFLKKLNDFKQFK